MNFQPRTLECVTIPLFIEILFSLLQPDKEDLHRLLPGFPCRENVNENKFLLSFEDNGTVKLYSQKNQLTIQTNAEALRSYLPSLRAQLPHLTHRRSAFFKNFKFVFEPFW
jgi:hypothetical protein